MLSLLNADVRIMKKHIKCFQTLDKSCPSPFFNALFFFSQHFFFLYSGAGSVYVLTLLQIICHITEVMGAVELTQLYKCR